MDWGPGVSGLIGGLVAAGLSYLWSGQVPSDFRGRDAQSLIAEYRWHYRAVNFTFFASLCGAIVAYSRGWAANNDWRLLFTAFGGGIILPLAVLYGWLGRDRFADFWFASCAKDDVPFWVARWMVYICAAGLFAGLTGYLRNAW